MSSLLIRLGRRRKVFQVLDPEFTVGSDEGNALRIQSHDVLARHLRFVAVGEGLRVEPLAADAKLTVNGRAAGARELMHGDRIAIGPVELVFWAEGMPRPEDDDPTHEADEPAADGAAESTRSGLELRIDAIPTAAITRAATSPHRRRTAATRTRRQAAVESDPPRRVPRRRGMSPTLVWWNAALVALVVGFVLFRLLSSQTKEAGPRDLVTLADSQSAAGDHARALATLQVALGRATDVATRDRIRDLQREIEADLARRADLPSLERARRDAERIRRFVSMYLVEDPSSRPAARELLRMAREWLDEHHAVVSRHDDHRMLIDEIEGYLRRYGGAAGEGTRDTVEDVMFAAARRTRFQPRRFPDAIAILERWLATAPADAPGRAEVESAIATYREDGQRYVKAQRKLIAQLVAAGQIESAIRELRDVVEHAALPEWLSDERELLSELEERR